MGNANPHQKKAPKGRSAEREERPNFVGVPYETTRGNLECADKQERCQQGHGRGNADAFEWASTVCRKAHDVGDAAPCPEVPDREHTRNPEPQSIEEQQDCRTPQEAHVFGEYLGDVGLCGY